jgi:hypothetical protein
MATYEQARANKFRTAASETITGIDLTAPESSQLAESEYQPMQLCLCVTDPCDCGGPIIWIKPDDIYGRDATGRSNRAGEEVGEFRINPDATVLVESVVRAKASALLIDNRRLRLRPSSHFQPPRNGMGRECGGAAAQRQAPGAYYDGQECAGGTTYDVWVEADGLDTTFHYVAVGSC